MEIKITMSIKVEDLAEFINSKFPQKIAFDEELINYLPKVKKSREFTDLNNKYFKMKINKKGYQTFYLKTMNKRINLGNTIENDLYSIKEKYYQELGCSRKITLASYLKLEMESDFYHLKKTTVRDYKMYINNYILPELGSKEITDISPRDIKLIHKKLHKTPYLANRILAVLSRTFNLAKEENIYTDENPCINIKRYKERKCNRFLSNNELERLHNAMNQMTGTQDNICKDMIIFLLYSGVRLSEMLSMKNQQFHNDIITWKDTKTGEKNLPLMGKIKEIFKKFQAVAMVSEKRLRKYFKKVLHKAGIKHFRLHDLRHTFATYASRSGVTAEHIRMVLNHKNINTTIGYIHLDLTDMRETIVNTQQILDENHS